MMAIFGFIFGIFVCLYFTYAAICSYAIVKGFPGETSKAAIVMGLVALICWYLFISNAPFSVSVQQ